VAGYIRSNIKFQSHIMST